MRRVVLACVIAAFLATGCEHLKGQKRTNSFDDAVNAYRILIRWGQYEEALRYIVVRPGQGTLPPVDLEPLQQIRLASYDINQKLLNDDETEADVHVAMTYYHEESNVLHGLRQVQHWWYSEEQKRWFLESAFPDFIGNLKKDR